MQRLFFEDHHVLTKDVSKDVFNRIFYYSANGTPISLVSYYDDIVEKILKENFELKKCTNKHIWYGEWENNRRMVIKLHYFYSHEIRFGYNYDYIPRLTNQDKFVYHRTERSVDLDVMDYYINHISYNPDNLTEIESAEIRRHYYLQQYGYLEELDSAKEYIENVVRNNIFFYKRFLR